MASRDYIAKTKDTAVKSIRVNIAKVERKLGLEKSDLTVVANASTDPEYVIAETLAKIDKAIARIGKELGGRARE